MKRRMTLLAALVALVPLAAPGPAPAAVAARRRPAGPGRGVRHRPGLPARARLRSRRAAVRGRGRPGRGHRDPGHLPRVHLAVRALPQRPHRPDLPHRPGGPPHHRGRRAAVGRDRFGDVLGAADVEVRGRTVYALVAGGGCSRGLESSPSGVWRLDRDRGWTVVADFSRFLAANPTAAPPDDDFEPDGAVYSMVGAGGRLIVLEANHGELDKVDPAPSSGAPRSSSGSPSTAATSGSWPPA
jgi:hypothetical protein